MKITLVRHAQTEQNYLHILQGRSNNLLNDTGRRQAKLLKDKLSGEHYDVCYMSPLVRTVETALILIGDRVEMIPDERLIERDLGKLEGVQDNQYDSAKYWNYELNSSDDGVESIQNVFKRCQSFVDYILEKHSGEDILIVSHATPIRAIHHILNHTDLNSKSLAFDIKNCYCETINIDLNDKKM